LTLEVGSHLTQLDVVKGSVSVDVVLGEDRLDLSFGVAAPEIIIIATRITFFAICNS